MHRLLARLTLREDVVGDLLQELFIRLCNSKAFDNAEVPFAYAHRVAMNLAFEWHRKRKIMCQPLLEHGLRNKRRVSIRDISEPERVHHPFWVAYFKKRGSYDFKALDAVSGEVQGIKMRKVFLAAFRHMTGNE